MVSSSHAAVPQHSPEYKRRRLLNWFPLGLTYAFLYMARYNLTVSKNALGDLMTKADFGTIFAVGTIGSLVGCYVGPLFLFPTIGSRASILLCAGVLAAHGRVGLGLFLRLLSWLPLSWWLLSWQALSSALLFSPVPWPLSF